MGRLRGVNAPIGGIRQFSHALLGLVRFRRRVVLELLQVHVEIHKSASSHPLGPRSVGAVFYLYSAGERIPHPGTGWRWRGLSGSILVQQESRRNRVRQVLLGV